MAFGEAYNVANFKSAKGMKRALTYDLRRKGPYARSIDTYKPRKNDWYGVDDIGSPLGQFAESKKRGASSKPPSAKQLAARAAFAERYGRR